MVEAAIEILKLQAEIFPESANSYDSLGEVFEASDQLDLAEKNFRKALEIDPEFEPSKEGLERVISQSQK
jgi:tetratricopeptide (TPR) repeat protein